MRESSEKNVFVHPAGHSSGRDEQTKTLKMAVHASAPA